MSAEAWAYFSAIDPFEDLLLSLRIPIGALSLRVAWSASWERRFWVGYVSLHLFSLQCSRVLVFDHNICFLPCQVVGNDNLYYQVKNLPPKKKKRLPKGTSPVRAFGVFIIVNKLKNCTPSILMSNLFLADKALAYTSILIIKSPY